MRVPNHIAALHVCCAILLTPTSLCVRPPSQGDKEADFGITISPLCDRNTTETLSESQIGA